jgi:hypothetical protein
MAHLRRLTFNNIYLRPGDLPAMAAAATGPQLELLHFHDCRFVSDAMPELVAMLSQASRASGAWDVRTLHISQINKTQDSLPPHILDQLNSLVGKLIREDIVDF